ncbi:GntR family transcriptional regulator [Desulfopila aestuarii]|uniref:DNA-binding transcriptional regulator, GntR family n=1 Tax=Desulfopila aestuarii DSM 18488 TaxID=1121416 RepID=A0A1M7Y3B3_9BACT|nr:GntR family transcriptional regulator [Desulfopila aestuarii]SHO46399.1 DNA-binding transcriptional regulator, GntR family [Desulfopila aestuarii DSM 18488]
MAIVKSTYKDQVVEYVYNLVLDGVLSPGDQIKESLLAVEMGISRAPIREALKELMTNGIIEYRPQVGNFITQLSQKEIVDAYITRGILEGYAVASGFEQFTDLEISKLEEMTRLMTASAEAGNRKEVVQVGDDFHTLLISKCDNMQLIDYTRRLSQKLHILFYKFWSRLYSAEEVGDRHLRIIKSIKSGNRVEIEQSIRAHYQETGSKIAQDYT